MLVLSYVLFCPSVNQICQLQLLNKSSTVCGTNACMSVVNILLKNLSYKGAQLQNYSFQSYDPCPANASCHD